VLLLLLFVGLERVELVTPAATAAADAAAAAAAAAAASDGELSWRCERARPPASAVTSWQLGHRPQLRRRACVRARACPGQLNQAVAAAVCSP